MKISFRMLMLTVLFVWGIQSILTAQVIEKKDGQRIEFRFTKDLTSQDLEQMKESATAFGFKLVYNDLDFDEKGKLAGIDFSVDCPKDGSGGAKSYGLRKNSSFGFFVDRSPGASAVFGTGAINYSE
jgi:hypothetical protein